MENDKEIWKEVSGYNGMYLVSNFGRVKSLKKYGTSERFLSLREDDRGYYRTKLSLNGKHTCIRVHRLVALAFIENPLNKRDVNHIDCNKKNNHISNLEWVSNAENIAHAYENNLHDNHYKKQRLVKKARGINRFAGVTFDRFNNKWRSSITIKGKQKTIGRFNTELEALNSRKSAMLKYGFATVEELNKL